MATQGKASRVCQKRKKMKTKYKENSSLFFFGQWKFFSWLMNWGFVWSALTTSVPIFLSTADTTDMACKTVIYEPQNNLSNAYPIQTWPCISAHTVQLNYAISYKLSPTKNADSKMHFGKYVIIQEVVFLSSCPDRSMYIYLVTGHEQYMVSNSFPLSIDH